MVSVTNKTNQKGHSEELVISEKFTETHHRATGIGIFCQNYSTSIGAPICDSCSNSILTPSVMAFFSLSAAWSPCGVLSP